MRLTYVSDLQDLARLFIWVLREYSEVEPIILSGGHSAAVLSSRAGPVSTLTSGSRHAPKGLDREA